MVEIKVDKQELMQILNVKKEGLKTIEKRKQLKNRLKDKGYKLVDKVKEGRKSLYILEKCEPQIINRYKLNIPNFKVDYNKRNHIGIYYILKDNDIYIGSTIDGYRSRFRRHWEGDKNMEHTYELLHNGGEFYILHDMIDIEDEVLIRMVEQEYINYFMNYTDFNVINHMNKVTWKGKNYKPKYKKIKVRLEDYGQAIQLLKNNGLYA